MVILSVQHVFEISSKSEFVRMKNGKPFRSYGETSNKNKYLKRDGPNLLKTLVPNEQNLGMLKFCQSLLYP